MAQAVFAGEPVKSMRYFDRVQVFALNVFDERHFQQAFICEILYDDRNFGQTGQASCSPASLARDELVAILFASNDERLDDAVRSYRLG